MRSDDDPRGIITNIQRFSLHDGPGIRTTVFFKGCRLKCKWCHNPENIGDAVQVLYYASKCAHCGRCVQRCPVRAHAMAASGHEFRHDLCVACGRCVRTCPAGALELAGRVCTAREVADAVAEDAPFYASSGGGVTFSGGDCMGQPGFLLALLKTCREAGIHTAVDTSGFFPWPAFEAILPWTDLFLYDIKAFDRDLHAACTGVPNDVILENAVRLDRAGAAMVIRVPVIPGYNDSRENARSVAAFLSGFHTKPPVELLRYNRLASSKYAALGMPYAVDAKAEPDEERLRDLLGIFKNAGCDARIR